MDEKLKEPLSRFISAFEKVFDEDWLYTKEMLGIHDKNPVQEKKENDDELEYIHFISPNGTFLHPKVEDETENWGYRAELLSAYRQMKN